MRCFGEKSVKHPWGKKQGRYPAALMLSMEPRDAAPMGAVASGHGEGARAFSGLFCSCSKRKVAEGLAGLVREAARLG